MIDITIIENDVNSFQKPMEEEMKTPIKHFEGELLKIRTGRAHTSLVEDIQALGYSNMPMPIKQLATITAPEARLIIIEPWDPTMLDNIEKAILTSDTGLNPANDGKIIRLQLPNLSSERREELVKMLGKKTNECKDRVRQIRQEFNNALRDAKKNKKISENFADRLTDVLQKVTDKFTAQADQLSEKKAAEIRSI